MALSGIDTVDMSETPPPSSSSGADSLPAPVPPRPSDAYNLLIEPLRRELQDQIDELRKTDPVSLRNKNRKLQIALAVLPILTALMVWLWSRAESGAIDTTKAEWEGQLKQARSTFTETMETVRDRWNGPPDRSSRGLFGDLQHAFSNEIGAERTRWRREFSDSIAGWDGEVKSVLRDAQAAKGEVDRLAAQAVLRWEDIRSRARSIEDLAEGLSRNRPLLEAFERDRARAIQILTESESFREDLIREASLLALPVGTVIAWPGEPPAGDAWRVCDGTEVEDATGRLAALLDPVTGKSEREGWVILPNYQGYFLRGHDPKRAIDKQPNRRIGSEQSDALRDHTHGFSDYHVTHGQKDDDDDGGPHSFVGELTSVDRQTKGVSKTDVLADTSETRPINRSVNWLIKVR